MARFASCIDWSIRFVGVATEGFESHSSYSGRPSSTLMAANRVVVGGDSGMLRWPTVLSLCLCFGLCQGSSSNDTSPVEWPI